MRGVEYESQRIKISAISDSGSRALYTDFNWIVKLQLLKCSPMSILSMAVLLRGHTCIHPPNHNQPPSLYRKL